MYEALFLSVIIGYIAFRNWLNHDKRRMIHRERMAAIEKGIALPAVEHEAERRTWNVQRFLLLAGWSWIAIGIGGFIALNAVLSGALPAPTHEIPPSGTQYAAVIPIGIGIAHLITYWTGERRERAGR
jgi:hypothetical protein